VARGRCHPRGSLPSRTAGDSPEVCSRVDPVFHEIASQERGWESQVGRPRDKRGRTIALGRHLLAAAEERTFEGGIVPQ